MDKILYTYEKNERLWGLMHTSGLFSQEKTPLPSDGHSHLEWNNCTALFISNIMKYSKNDIEWQTSKEDMNLSEVWDYFGKEKEALTLRHLWRTTVMN